MSNQDKDALERLDDWEALCAWLEDRPYNAAYEPRCRGAYLLNTPYPARRTIWETQADGRVKEVPNPKLDEEKALSKWTREITAERRRLGLVYWASGYGWRLRKDYREKLQAERAAIARARAGE